MRADPLMRWVGSLFFSLRTEAKKDKDKLNNIFFDFSIIFWEEMRPSLMRGAIFQKGGKGYAGYKS